MTPAVKYRPILFTGEMVRALLNTKPDTWPAEAIDAAKPCKWQTRRLHATPAAVGDVLWVRESWLTYPNRITARMLRDGADSWPEFGYVADDDGQLECLGWVRKPSIHMPMTACRLWLRVMAVRREPLQSITEAGALAEGAYAIGQDDCGSLIYADPFGTEGVYSAVMAFSRLWQTIYSGDNCWYQNPTVTVYEFQRISRPEGWCA